MTRGTTAAKTRAMMVEVRMGSGPEESEVMARGERGRGGILVGL